MVLAHSLNGKLRLRQMRNGKGVVELDCHGTWVWCVWRSLPIQEAFNLFANQCRFHLIKGN